MRKETSVLFLTLNVFSATGGIEKVCRVVGKALYEITHQGQDFIAVHSLHDQEKPFNNNYFTTDYFKFFKGSILKFIISSVTAKRKTNHIVLMSHINVLVVGVMIKKLWPRSKLILMAHGIEVWGKLRPFKKYLLKQCDQIVAVSCYTAENILDNNSISRDSITILNNCLDPYLPVSNNSKTQALKNQLHITGQQKIMLAVTRYSSKEKYKGYDKVLEVMNDLIAIYPKLKYLLVGKYDVIEKARLDALIDENGLKDHVTLTGFVSNEDLADYFNIADVFVMPSEKEGFGIVFIEAMHYGLPVIAGNKDGSVDALLNGRLGKLVDPDNSEDIKAAITTILNYPENHQPDQQLLNSNFGYDHYRKRWDEILSSWD